MPQKQSQSDSLSLPQLLQLAGIGGQPQQDSTREALSYMMGQQRIASEDADRKARQLQAEQDNAYRMKALDTQVNQKDNTAALHALGLLFANSTDPVERAKLSAHIRSLAGMPEEPVVTNPETAAAERNRLSLEEAQKRNASFQEATSAKNLGRTASDLTGFLHSPLKTAEGTVTNFGDFWGPLVDNFTSGFMGTPTLPEQAAITQANIAQHYAKLPAGSMPPLQLQGLASQLGSEVPQNVLNGLTPVQMQELLKTVAVAKPNQTLSFQP